jgi:hypothetical protein
MARKIQGHRIATANRLQDGLVVFLSAHGKWSRDLNAARVARSDAEADALEQAAAASARSNTVVDPYLISVDVTSGSPVPVAHRERLRASGPTVGHSLGVQTPVEPARAA